MLLLKEGAFKDYESEFSEFLLIQSTSVTINVRHPEINSFRERLNAYLDNRRKYLKELEKSDNEKLISQFNMFIEQNHDHGKNYELHRSRYLLALQIKTNLTKYIEQTSGYTQLNEENRKTIAECNFLREFCSQNQEFIEISEIKSESTVFDHILTYLRK
jgi:hypothetical protein